MIGQRRFCLMALLLLFSVDILWAGDSGPIRPDRRPASVRRNPMTVRDRVDARRNEAEMLGQISDLESQVTMLKAEKAVLSNELKAILAVARKEKAQETVRKINALLEKKQNEYDGRVALLEEKLQKLNTILADNAKRRRAQNRLGTTAPRFSAKTTDGREISLQDFQGKIVVLEWVNPDCPFSRYYYEKKIVQKLVSKYADQGVVWLSINSNMRSTSEQNQQFVEKYGVHHLWLMDRSAQIAGLYYAKVTPHVFIIDENGVIVYNGAIDNSVAEGRGDQVVSYVDRALSEVLAHKPVTVPYAEPSGTPIGGRTIR